MKSTVILATVLFAAAASHLHAQAHLEVPAQYVTIQQAIDHAQAGDVVTVSEGTYLPFFLVDKTDVTVRAKGKVIIDASGISFGVHLLNCQGIVLKKLRVRNSTNYGIRVLSSQVRVVECRISDSAGDGISANDAAGSELLKNHVTDVGGHGVVLDSNDVLSQQNRVARTGKSGFRILGDGNSVTDNEILEPHDIGIELGVPGDGANDNLVLNNRVMDASAGVLQDEGSGCSILENRIGGDLGTGILTLSDVDGVLVSDNRIQGPSMSGLSIDCASGVFVKNRMKKVGASAIVVYPPSHDCEFRKNVVDKTGVGGILISGTGHTVDENKVSKAGASGIVVEGEQNRFIRNNVKKSGECGFRVVRKNNLLRKNVAKASQQWDLWDSTEPGDNSYIKNEFGTIAP